MLLSAVASLEFPRVQVKNARRVSVDTVRHPQIWSLLDDESRPFRHRCLFKKHGS